MMKWWMNAERYIRQQAADIRNVKKKWPYLRVLRAAVAEIIISRHQQSIVTRT